MNSKLSLCIDESSKSIKKRGKTMKPSPRRHQLNIRLTAAQDQMIRQKALQTNKTKTELILDLLNNTPIYALPNFNETLKQIKYLGNKTNELSQKLSEQNCSTKQTQKLINDLQKGCNELWQLLKLLRQDAPKQP